MYSNRRKYRSICTMLGEQLLYDCVDNIKDMMFSVIVCLCVKYIFFNYLLDLYLPHTVILE